MVRRGELTDEAWVKPPLLEGGQQEHRTVTNGILWRNPRRVRFWVDPPLSILV
jgi:hypothetical protein